MITQSQGIDQSHHDFIYLHNATLPSFQSTYSLSTYAEKIRALDDNFQEITIPPPLAPNHPLLSLIPKNYEHPHNILRRIINIPDKAIKLPPLLHTTPKSIISCFPNLYSDNSVLDDLLNLLCIKFSHVTSYTSTDFTLYQRKIQENDDPSDK